MKVSASGYSRYCGTWALADSDDGTGSAIEISHVTPRLTLNGQYRLRVTLTKGDVARYFLQTFGNADLNTVLSVLESARAKQTTGQTSSAAA